MAVDGAEDSIVFLVVVGCVVDLVVLLVELCLHSPFINFTSSMTMSPRGDAGSVTVKTTWKLSSISSIGIEYLTHLAPRWLNLVELKHQKKIIY